MGFRLLLWRVKLGAPVPEKNPSRCPRRTSCAGESPVRHEVDLLYSVMPSQEKDLTHGLPSEAIGTWFPHPRAY